jgi:membrane associated rhomboid family serine protease
MMILAIFFGILSVPSACQASKKLTDSQIQTIQDNIRKCVDLSTQCSELQSNSDQNYSNASSNFQKTSLQGFRQAAELYSEAKTKSSLAGNLFHDAWIQMQYGMQNDDLNQIQKGTDLHNSAVQHYNQITQILSRAAGIFNQTVQESQNRVGANSRANNSQTGLFSINSAPSHPDNLFSDIQRTGTFPIVALIILIMTALISFCAFRDRRLTDRYILQPWSIVHNKTRYYTLVSNGLIHADPMHLTMNLMSFSFFALPLEAIIGHLRFLLVYFGSLLLSSIAVTARQGNNGFYCCLGASGAISGVIFSYIIYHPNATINMMIAPMGVPAPIFALAFIGYSYFMSKAKYDNIAHDSHLWGAVAGALITLILDPDLMGKITKLF